LVLSAADLGGAAPGDDAAALLHLPDAVLDIAVTPDRGYCLSMRGIAREAAHALGLAFADPATAPPEGDRDAPGPADTTDLAGKHLEEAEAADEAAEAPAAAVEPAAGEPDKAAPAGGAPDGVGWPVQIDDPVGCDRFSAWTLTGLDPATASPLWMR